METFFRQINHNWELRYNTFVDELILFDPQYNSVIDKRFKQESNDIVVGYFGNIVIYVKIEGAIKYFGEELEEMSKNDIINKLKEFVYA